MARIGRFRDDAVRQRRAVPDPVGADGVGAGGEHHHGGISAGLSGTTMFLGD